MTDQPQKAKESDSRRGIAQETSKDVSNELQKTYDDNSQRQTLRKISEGSEPHKTVQRECPQDMSKAPQDISKDPDESQKAAEGMMRRNTIQIQTVPSKISGAGSRRETLWEQSIRGFQISFMTSVVSSLNEPKNLFWAAENLPGGDYYDGQWDKTGMSGVGSYTFLNEAEYVGGMSDGRFHGYGVLNYPDGNRVEGKWEKGVLNERQIIFSDDLTFTDGDKYAQLPDRRFNYEFTMGMNPAGCSILTDRNPTRRIPPGYYDTEDGFYDPVRNVVVDVDDLHEIIRIPEDPAWIVSHCRKAWDEPVGPRPDLFEQWMKCKEPDEKNGSEVNDEISINHSFT